MSIQPQRLAYNNMACCWWEEHTEISRIDGNAEPNNKQTRQYSPSPGRMVQGPAPFKSSGEAMEAPWAEQTGWHSSGLLTMLLKTAKVLCSKANNASANLKGGRGAILEPYSHAWKLGNYCHLLSHTTMPAQSPTIWDFIHSDKEVKTDKHSVSKVADQMNTFVILSRIVIPTKKHKAIQ